MICGETLMSKKVEELKRAYRRRDQIVRFITENHHFRVSVVKNTRTAQIAQQRHGLGPLPAVMLAKALAASSLLASFLKGEERVVVEFMGNGPIRKVLAEALKVGEVRGYVGNPLATLDFQQEKVHIGDALGVGVLRVSKILYNRVEPVTGIVELRSGDISSDVAYYLWRSEQIPSVVLLDVSIDDRGIIEQSGGILIQTLPGAQEEEIQKIEKQLRMFRSLTTLFVQGYMPPEIAQVIVPFPLQKVDSTPIDFFCRCSKERFKAALLMLGQEELKGMLEDGHRELVCKYCGERYELTEEELRSMIAQLDAKKN